MKLVFFTIISAVALLGALMSILLLFRFRWSKGGAALWGMKSYTSALSIYLGIASADCAISGFFAHAPIVVLLGALGAIVYFIYLCRIAFTDVWKSFSEAFGSDWQLRIPVSRKRLFLKHALTLRLPESKGFVLKQDVPFATVPESGRQLLCDLWLPSEETEPSGLAFIYLHGGAWSYLDKDFSTRPLFRHLVSQGHVVMDVAYRLFPETDMKGMIQDAKRAIAWMKANAQTYKVNSEHIVIGGGSAGGHLALMAAYLPDEQQLAPPELQGVDFSVKAVIGAYAPPDLVAHYFHTDQQITTRNISKQSAEKQEMMPQWMRKFIGKDYHRLGYDKSPTDSALVSILGCHPDECPDVYSYFSPVTHVRPGCPPTLLLQGAHDMFTPVAATYQLYQKLKEAGVPVVKHILPQTDHGFDLFMPKHSPVAHVAFYDIERFLALMAEGQSSENKLST